MRTASTTHPGASARDADAASAGPAAAPGGQRTSGPAFARLLAAAPIPPAAPLGVGPLVALALALGALLAAPPAAAPLAAQDAPDAAAAGPHCTPMAEPEKLDDRLSPYDSLRVDIGDAAGIVCYGRPSSRGRVMIGGDKVPFGKIWRTGANEPTILHLTYAAALAGIELEPGSYSIYTVPGKDEWTVVVNASTSQWGHERYYTGEVAAQEIGRAVVASERLEDHVETFTITAAPAGEGRLDLVLEWEHTRVAIPLERRGA